MPKLFISYSHKDESYREQFQNHLSGLKENGLIDTWTDRCIGPGEEWEPEIHKNLANAKFVLLLISSDFLASKYCTGVEMQRALQMHQRGEAIVVPIVIRPVDWMDYEIGKIQALPEWGKPISDHDSSDAAWVSVVRALKDKIKSANQSNDIVNGNESLEPNTLTTSFQEWLCDTDVVLVHRNIAKVTLADVFIAPDLKRLDIDSRKISLTIGSLDKEVLHNNSLILGDEQSGKTALVKQMFIQLREQGLFPICMSAEAINTSKLEKLVHRALKHQYQDVGQNLSIQSQRCVLIIDDFDQVSLNKKHTSALLQSARSLFKHTILIADEPYRYVTPDIPELNNFQLYSILPFGNSKRSELIQRWVELGVAESISEEEVLRSLDTLKVHVDSLVRRNIVPSKPIYLLTILQTFESYAPLGVDLTSYGHCYQQMIYRAFEKAMIRPVEYDAYINFLTELAGAIFRNDSQPLSDEEQVTFYDSYADKYLGTVSSAVIDKLTETKILNAGENGIDFKYRYFYYFYVAKHLADQLSQDSSSKEQIHNLVVEMHREQCANIIIFLTHHTKNQWILDELMISMMELFDDTKEATLETGDLAFMHEFLEDLPKLIVHEREVEKERKENDHQKDQQEEEEEKLAKEMEGIDPNTLLARINRAFRGIEIVGQIIRNRHGSLERGTLLALLTEAYSVGLRFLQFFLRVSDTAKAEIISDIRHLMRENPNIEDELLEERSARLFLFFSYGVIYSVIRKIAFSVGAKETGEIHRKLLERNDTPAVKLINETVNLQFLKTINQNGLKELAHEFSENPVCKRMLAEIVIQHLYMHDVPFKDKQQVSEVLGVPLEKQILINYQKRQKE